MRQQDVLESVRRIVAIADEDFDRIEWVVLEMVFLPAEDVVLETEDRLGDELQLRDEWGRVGRRRCDRGVEGGGEAEGGTG